MNTKPWLLVLFFAPPIDAFNARLRNVSHPKPVSPATHKRLHFPGIGTILTGMYRSAHAGPGSPRAKWTALARIIRPFIECWPLPGCNRQIKYVLAGLSSCVMDECPS